MNEHFKSGVFLFTDNTAEALAAEIERRSSVRAPDRGLLLAQEWNPILGNLSGSFSIRLIHHLASDAPSSRGVFYAALQGRQLGNFDVSYDPDNQDQIHIGQLKYKDERPYYDTWTSFAARAFRGGTRQVAAPISSSATTAAAARAGRGRTMGRLPTPTMSIACMVCRPRSAGAGRG